jgi:hypothetical protein
MTKYLSDKYGYGYRPNADTPISIGAEEWNAESRPPYICDFGHHTLVKLQNKTNTSWFCRNCNTEYDPEAEKELRSESKILMAEGPVTDPSVSYAPERTIQRRKNQPKGTFRKMQERGMHITNYQERGWRKEKESE